MATFLSSSSALVTLPYTPKVRSTNCQFNTLSTIVSSNKFRDTTFFTIVNITCYDWYIIKVGSWMDPRWKWCYSNHNMSCQQLWKKYCVPNIILGHTFYFFWEREKFQDKICLIHLQRGPMIGRLRLVPKIQITKADSSHY